MDEIRIRNFKSLRDVQVTLNRLTAVVGPNGSGKSSVLQALHAFSRAFNEQPLRGNDIAIRDSITRGATEPIQLVGRFGDQLFRYCSSFTADPSGQASAATFETAATSRPAQWKPSKQGVVPKAALLQLTAQNLMSTNLNQPDSSTMSPTGVGLHAALASIALNEPESWTKLQDDLRGILPAIRRLRHARVSQGQIPELLFDTIVGDSLGAPQMSEGSLLVLGMLTALYAPDCPNLVLLDDVDRGLHPKAQHDLVELLRRVLERKPGLQIVVTTHSPYLLNDMSPSEVRVTCLRDDGSTACAPIESHPNFAKWKDEMAPGEMWSLFGEKWTTGGAAA